MAAPSAIVRDPSTFVPSTLRAVGRPEVADLDPVAVDAHGAVARRRGLIRQPELAVGAAADDYLTGEIDHRAAIGAGLDDESHHGFGS